MKISVTVQIGADDSPVNEAVLQNLEDVGFEKQVDGAGNMELAFEGDISPNDLAYGASLCKNMRKS